MMLMSVMLVFQEKEKDRRGEKERETKERDKKTSNGHLFTPVCPSAATCCQHCNKLLQNKESLHCSRKTFSFGVVDYVFHLLCDSCCSVIFNYTVQSQSSLLSAVNNPEVKKYFSNFHVVVKSVEYTVFVEVFMV